VHALCIKRALARATDLRRTNCEANSYSEVIQKLRFTLCMHCALNARQRVRLTSAGRIADAIRILN